MIITVVGSFQAGKSKRAGKGANLAKGKAPDENKARTVFDTACKAIGRVLGEKGHRLIIAHRYDLQGKPSKSAEALALSGFLGTAGKHNFEEVPHHDGDPELKAHTEAVERSDAVILIGGKEGTYAAGLSALLRRKMIITVPAFGGSGRDLCEIAEINRTVNDKLRNLDTHDAGWEEVLTNSITDTIESYPRILIIHGRGDDGSILRDAIVEAGKEGNELEGLSAPIIMDLSGKGAVSVPEVFEKFASQVSATIAIVTADDIGGFARLDVRREDDHPCQTGSKEAGETEKRCLFARGGAQSGSNGLPALPATELTLAPRARENVWVEVGWFWGRLGRQRIFLWLEDKVPLPSDLQGAAWSKGSFTQAWPQIRNFINNLREGEIEP